VLNVSMVEIYTSLAVVRWRQSDGVPGNVMRENFLSRGSGPGTIELIDEAGTVFRSGRSGASNGRGETQFPIDAAIFNERVAVLIDGDPISMSPLMALPWRRLHAPRVPDAPYEMVPLIGALPALGRAVALELYDDHCLLRVIDDRFLQPDAPPPEGPRERIRALLQQSQTRIERSQELKLHDDIGTDYQASTHSRSNGLAGYHFTPAVPPHARRVTLTAPSVRLTAALPDPGPQIGGLG
jgi:hypothetical protein